MINIGVLVILSVPIHYKLTHEITGAGQANMDTQFIFDEYACMIFCLDARCMAILVVTSYGYI